MMGLSRWCWLVALGLLAPSGTLALRCYSCDEKKSNSSCPGWTR